MAVKEFKPPPDAKVMVGDHVNVLDTLVVGGDVKGIGLEMPAKTLGSPNGRTTFQIERVPLSVGVQIGTMEVPNGFHHSLVIILSLFQV